MSKPLHREALELLTLLRAKKGNPSLLEIAQATYTSKSSVHTLFGGSVVQWTTTERIAKYLGISDDDHDKLRDLWVKSKLSQDIAPTKQPPWVEEIKFIISEMNVKLDELRKMLSDPS